jgi:hypothetical protein
LIEVASATSSTRRLSSICCPPVASNSMRGSRMICRYG